MQMMLRSRSLAGKWSANPDWNMAPPAAAGTGWLYPLVAGALGAWLVVEAFQLLRRARAGQTDAALNPMRLFHYSNSYLALVFIAAAVDPLVF